VDLELLLSMAVSLDPERIAVSDLNGGSLTTGRLDAAANGAASLLRGSGADNVAFCDTNNLSFPVSLFGAVKARMPFVPLNYRLADEQLSRIVSGQSLTAVASAEQAQRLRRLGVTQVFESSEFLKTAADADSISEINPADTDGVALLLYTSGTTGAPKAAVLRHRHLAAYVINTVEFGGAEPEDATLLSVPPYHIAGVMNLLSNLYMGRRLVYLDNFSAERWLSGIASEGITHAMVVPTMLARIVAILGDHEAQAPTLRTISYGGAKMPRAVIDKALRLFPDVAFTNAYGLTETSSTVAVLGPEDHRRALESDDEALKARLGSVGMPLPGVEIEVRDEAGALRDAGTVGDIFVRGEQVAGEYLGSTEGDESWFATRDRGFFDDAGYLFIEGRADDTIIRGGENISPAEIEEVLLAHDDVIDCAAVGVDDEEWGQSIVAAVVLMPGSTVEAEGLRAFARQSLRGSKTPERIILVDELPYTDTGKLLRRVVREQMTKAIDRGQPRD
jgi:acyl-CoA synthetase (AMP-forming)/AMP-acid ligase II